MRVAHVVATVDDFTAGPSHSVAELARSLAEMGADVAVETVAGWRGAPPEAELSNLRRHRQDFVGIPLLSKLCVSSEMFAALRNEAARLDIIHSHGLWLMPNVYPSWAALGTACSVVLSPRGMLGPEALAFSSPQKAMFWRLLQRRAMRAVGCLHATSLSEYEEIRAFGIKLPVAVIRNGIAVPPPSAVKAAAVRTALALGRIHPKKGLADLILAWSKISGDHPDWRLRIAGPDENGHAAELLRLARDLKLESVSIEGPAVGKEKHAAFAQAELFVLSTHNENFAMTVAESLAAGVPVLCTRGAPWADLEAKGCGWWVDVGPDSLAAALGGALVRSPAELASMGARGRAWMQRDFAWEKVAAEMLQVYAWLRNGGPPPPQLITT